MDKKSAGKITNIARTCRLITFAILLITALGAVGGCSGSSKTLRLSIGGDLALAPAIPAGKTDDYYTIQTTNDLERHLRHYKVVFVSPDRVAQRIPSYYKPESQAAINKKKSVIDLLKIANEKGIELLIISQVEVMGKTKLIQSRRSSWTPHIGIGIGPVGIGTSIRPRRKPPTERLFYSVDIHINIYETSSRRPIYITRAFDSKATDEPEKMISDLSKKLAKRIRQKLKERYRSR